MNQDILKISQYLSANYSNLQDTFTNLSRSSDGQPLVNDSNIAYNFDKISNAIYSPNMLKSSDALFLKNELYLIEFKKGLRAAPAGYRESRKSLKYEALKNCITAKISTSLHTIEKVIFNRANVNASSFKRNYIIVLDPSPSGQPVLALGQVLSQLAGIQSCLLSIWSPFILPYIDVSIRCFYDDVIVLNSINFSSKIAILP